MIAKLLAALKEVISEFAHAARKHKPYSSAHEGMGVIDEEFFELKLEVYKQKLDKALARKEAAQLASSAIRFMVDLC